MNRLHLFVLTTLTLSLAIQPLRAADPVEEKASKAIAAGLDWLAEQQAEDGSFSNPDFPALTAFVILSFAESDHAKRDEIMNKGADFIRSCVQDNGAIHVNKMFSRGDGLPNYNTAVCIRGLYAMNNPELTPIILKARTFLAENQVKEGDAKGGWGYSAPGKKSRADLLNSFYILEAMEKTSAVEAERARGEENAEVDKEAAGDFLKKLQHDDDEAGDAEGGFKYTPGEQGGLISKLRGKPTFRSYGSLTYAGTLGLIYADVDKSDDRVRSALKWAQDHWTLDENPGMGTAGLYFFYHVMTKCLDAAKVDIIKIQESDTQKELDWRKAVQEKLVSLQKTDGENPGSWVNENGRWWENDPVLTTSYAVMTLQHAMK